MYSYLANEWQIVALTPVFLFLSLWSLRLYFLKKKPSLSFNAYLFSASLLLVANQYVNWERPASIATASAIVDPEAGIEVAFSPQRGATELIVRTISDARESIQVAAYSFTSKPIAQALIFAHNRGVEVKVVLDKSQGRDTNSVFSLLRAYNIPTRINSRYAIMHNKFMIIDNETLQTGSFNYTKAAEFKNAENIMVVRQDPQTISQYSRQWTKLWDEAQY